MTRIYSGDLAKPIKLDSLPLLYTPEQYEARSKAYIAELERRMGLLCEAHGVKTGDWRNLCWRLAFDLSCFQLAEVERRGRTALWTSFTRLILVLSIEELQELGLSVTKATQRLANEEPWRSMVSHANGARRLRDESTRLTELDQKCLPLIRERRAQLIALGEITDEPGAFARNSLADIYAQDEIKNEQ
jgi:hypothetical protein